METIGLVRVLAGRDPITANHRGESGPNCSARARYPHEPVLEPAGQLTALLMLPRRQ